MAHQRKQSQDELFTDLIRDVDNEQACIGLTFKSTEFYRSIIGSLNIDCFTDPKTIACFKALQVLADSKGVPSTQSVKAKATTFNTKVSVAEISQWKFLAGEIQDPTATIEILHEYRRRRQTVNLLQSKAIETIENGNGESLQIIASIEKQLSEIKTATVKTANNGDEYFEILSDVANIQSGSQKPFVSLNLQKLDAEFSGGYQYGTLNIIGARPGTGKTAITMWWLRAWHQSGIKAGFVSLEMTPKQIAYREYAMETGIPYHRIMAGMVTPTERQTLVDTAYRLKENRFTRVCVGNCDSSKLRSIIMDMYFNSDCRVIVIDYLQRMRFEGKDNLVNIMGSAVNDLKALAVQYNICIVLLSQLSRESEKEKEPKIWHLRNSGMIEEAADTITLLHRPDMYGDDSPDIIRFLIEKNRMGQSNTDIHIYCNLSQNQFNDFAPQHQQKGVDLDSAPY